MHLHSAMLRFIAHCVDFFLYCDDFRISPSPVAPRVEPISVYQRWCAGAESVIGPGINRRDTKDMSECGHKVERVTNETKSYHINALEIVLAQFS